MNLPKNFFKYYEDERVKLTHYETSSTETEVFPLRLILLLNNFISNSSLKMGVQNHMFF
jgi:hypothetical protein